MKKHPDWNWSSIFARTFATGGAITLTGFAIAFSESRALAQVTPAHDGLNTQVTANGQVFEIMGGTPVVRSDGTVNLFHSFDRFSVPPSGSAEFLNNPINVANIFARVTGGTSSEIQGIIKAQGQANLFLMNPSGIIFGPNAQLNIGGSFVGTTANAIGFPNGGQFSMNSRVEPDNTLLAVNPNALFFNKTPAGVSVNQSTLQVGSGQNLFLVGGYVTLNGGTLRAPGGRIELGGLAESGEVKIVEAFDRNNSALKNNPNLNFPDVTFDFPEGVERADVSLINSAVVDVVADNGGDIFVNARNINISGGTNVCAGIGAGSACGTPGSAIGSLSSTAGNIAFDATGKVSITQSRIENNINPGASGNFGNIFEAAANNNTLFGSIIILTKSLSMTDGAQLSTSNFGKGSAGVVFVQASKEVFVDKSSIFSTRYAGDKGDAGGIVIEANSITLNNSTLESRIAGQGDGGVVSLEAEGGTVSLNNSKIRSDVTAGAVGNGRGISIEAESISLTNQSELQAQTSGEGNAGDVILLTNGGSVTLDNSKIFATVESGGEGNGGNIQIYTGSLSLNNGSGLQTLLRGPSDDGTLPGGKGNAGVVFVVATDSVSLSESGMFSRINPGANGNTGDNKLAGNIFDVLLGGDSDVVGSIFIATGKLSLTNNSELDSSTFGKGNAGAVVVLATDAVSLKNGSAIYSRVEPKGVGDSGGIVMGVGSLSVTDNSLITTSALGQGNPGFIIVKADEDISLRDNSGIFSRVGEDNRIPDVTRGGIFIDARSVFIKDGATVRVDNDGGGVAGDIEITAYEDIILNNKGTITALSASGQGGNIELTSGDFLLLLRNSEISTQAGSPDRPGSINGGNITINARYVITAPFSSNDLDAEAFGGAGGRIDITADRLYDIKERPLTSLSNDISATSGYGEPGEVTSNVLNADPTQGLANLPTDAVDPTRLIAETCAPRGGITERQKNQFIVTNRGGLPPDPNAAFPGEAVVTDQGTPNQQNNQPNSPHSTNPASSPPVATASPQPPENQPDNPSSTNSTGARPIAIASPQPPENQPDNPGSTNSTSARPIAIASPQPPENQPDNPGSTNSTGARPTAIASPQPPIVEAQGWVFDKNGDIKFTNEAPTGTPTHSQLIPASTCNGLSTQP